MFFFTKTYIFHPVFDNLLLLKVEKKSTPKPKLLPITTFVLIHVQALEATAANSAK